MVVKSNVLFIRRIRCIHDALAKIEIGAGEVVEWFFYFGVK